MPTEADMRFAQAAVKAGYLSMDKAEEILRVQKQAEEQAGAVADFRKVAVRKEEVLPQRKQRERRGRGEDTGGGDQSPD